MKCDFLNECHFQEVRGRSWPATSFERARATSLTRVGSTDQRRSERLVAKLVDEQDDDWSKVRGHFSHVE